jgi:hypothetical protein
MVPAAVLTSACVLLLLLPLLLSFPAMPPSSGLAEVCAEASDGITPVIIVANDAAAKPTTANDRAGIKNLLLFPVSVDISHYKNAIMILKT